jgi:hypothetical protein
LFLLSTKPEGKRVPTFGFSLALFRYFSSLPLLRCTDKAMFLTPLRAFQRTSNAKGRSAERILAKSQLTKKLQRTAEDEHRPRKGEMFK